MGCVSGRENAVLDNVVLPVATLQSPACASQLTTFTSATTTTSLQQRNMAPKYKLTYFGLKGLGEAIRFLLSYMEADWEDNRIEKEQWASLKETTPWGKLPTLEEDGKVLSQSLTILRYLGKKAGLAGKDDWENTQIDIIADTLTDLRTPISQFMWETNEEIKKTKKETWVKETLPFYLKKFEAVAKENGGYLANGKLSWVDFLFASLVEFLSYAADSDVLADYPNLNSLKQKITSLPQISKWLAKRPNTPF